MQVSLAHEFIHHRWRPSHHRSSSSTPHSSGPGRTLAAGGSAARARLSVRPRPRPRPRRPHRCVAGDASEVEVARRHGSRLRQQRGGSQRAGWRLAKSARAQQPKRLQAQCSVLDVASRLRVAVAFGEGTVRASVALLDEDVLPSACAARGRLRPGPGHSPPPGDPLTLSRWSVRRGRARAGARPPRPLCKRLLCPPPSPIRACFAPL